MSNDEESDGEAIELGGWSVHEIEEHAYQSESGEKNIKVKCAPELTPYDAILLADGEDLTGNRIWPGASVLFRYLEKNSASVKGKTVLELGAGCGLCGLMSGAMQASRTIITDGNESCVGMFYFLCVRSHTLLIYRFD